jgi:hypothetical protein
MKMGRFALLCVILVFLLIPAVSAAADYEVESIQISPSGDLSPGERVTVKCLVSLTGSDETFPDSDYLEAYTDLEDIEWTYKITVDGFGEDKPTTGKRYLTISGWLLSYPEDSDVEIDYVLEGTAPEVSATATKEIFRLRQYDDDDELVSGGEYVVERDVISQVDIDTTIAARESELSALRSSLDSAYAEGVDTSDAESAYNVADDALLDAKTASYSDVQSYLDKVETNIELADSRLSEAWAEWAVDSAEYTIGEVEGHLTYFKVNRSMTGDSRVLSIESQLDNANTLLTLAKDKQTSGDYSNARLQAQNANKKANEALNASLSLREEIGEGLSIGFGGILTYLVIGIIIIAAAAGGIYFYRKRRRWDELG